MRIQEYSVRTMTRAEVDLAVDWAAAEGWNPGLGDADSFFAADPQGFLVGCVGDEPMATMSVVRYGVSFAFLGFYIVKPEHRGRGYGLRIWDAGLERMAGRTIGLDGVLAQQENYKASGFALAYRNIRFQGLGPGDAVNMSDIRPVSELPLKDPFESLRSYDRSMFSVDRTAFLDSWIRQPGSRALGIIRKGELAGYGVIRPCRKGWKIGPLFADSPDLAERLFQALRTDLASDESYYLDVPEVNKEALALAGRHGLELVFETARMYRGRAPVLQLEKIFGVTTFELG